MPRDNYSQVMASLIGFGFGCFLGGFVVGSAADVLQAPIPTLQAYAIGAVLGGIAGAIGGRIASSVLFR